MLPSSDPSYLLDASCNLRGGEFPVHPPLLSQQPSPPTYFPLNATNLGTYASFVSIHPTYNFATYLPSQPHQDQISITEKAQPAMKKWMTLTAGGSGKQRSIRTDRHSKIHTAQGLRDRRMRLSLEVARKFFSLQDLLRFDKASATLDWLITQSRSAIEQHLVHFARATAKDVPSDSSLSANGSVKRLSLKKKDVLRSASFRKISLRHLLTKESRAVARARARERTKEKKEKKMQVVVDNDEASQFDHFADLLYNRNGKDEWPIGEVPDCTPHNQTRTLVERRMENKYFRMVMAGESSQPNEESTNFFHHQLAGNFSGEVADQQTSLFTDVQFRSSAACDMSSIFK